ncbi:MAG TPA: ABC transporter substrate-binding protein [Candidatus Binatia bacterium]|nr:ABC transporter substrate-binding protein [Candidatus Binatia bacterium]
MLLALCSLSEAQQSKKVPRIGYLAGRESSARIAAFRQGLRELGYVEGLHILIEYRFAEGRLDRLPELADELVRLKVDILAAESIQAALAAKNATTTIPIIMVNVGTDPVGSGLVVSLARPSGNITGFTNLAVELASKRLELLKEAVPKIRRVAVLYDPANQGNVIEVKGVQTVARPLGLTIQPWEVRGTDDFERVFAALGKERPDGLFVAGGPLMNDNEKRTAGFALKSRLSSTYVRREAVDAGGLMSYDSDHVDQYRRAATYIDKILKGAKPAELPVERPTKFELVINLKTAKQIGVTIPPSVLARADKIIK